MNRLSKILLIIALFLLIGVIVVRYSHNLSSISLSSPPRLPASTKIDTLFLNQLEERKKYILFPNFQPSPADINKLTPTTPSSPTGQLGEFNNL